MIQPATSPQPILDHFAEVRKRREAERFLDTQDMRTTIACSKGMHPHVVRGKCSYCNRSAKD